MPKRRKSWKSTLRGAPGTAPSPGSRRAPLPSASASVMGPRRSAVVKPPTPINHEFEKLRRDLETMANAMNMARATMAKATLPTIYEDPF